ncbi:MAG: ABC transporter ATP-binding protein [Flavisolibacter sp.]
MQVDSEVISVQHLSKQFTEIKAVDDLSFTVPRGVVYGFLGQNGAGKSTTIRMLLTLVKSDTGSIRLFGKDIREHRREILARIGAVIEKPDLYKYLTAYQNLQIMARLSGTSPEKKTLMDQLEQLGIADRAHSKVKTFSQGMKQRLGIACALVHNPELIILDEPANGLDPQGIADIRNLILHLSKEQNKTILVSSHLLNEIELIADHMLIIDKGKKVAEGKVSDLLNPSNTIVQLQTTDDTVTRKILKESAWATHLQASEALQLVMHKHDIPGLAAFLVERGAGIISIQPKHSLEDFFLSLTTSKPHVAAYRY